MLYIKVFFRHDFFTLLNGSRGALTPMTEPFVCLPPVQVEGITLMYAPRYAATLLDSCDARRGAFLRRKYSARSWIFRTPGSGISPTLSWYSQDCLSPVSRQTLDRETLSARRFSSTKERMSVFIATSSQNIEHCATNTLSVTIAMSLRVAPCGMEK